MVGEIDCSVDNRNYNRRHAEQQIFVLSKNSTYDEDRWRTTTKDAFPKPEVQKPQDNGRRKELVKKTLNESVLQIIADQMNPKVVDVDGDNPSEYIDNFCDDTFTPFMDQQDTDVNTFRKYPLYACSSQTLYKEQVERGSLKSRSEISNWNEPFRKNCSFTTSPDLAFREPTVPQLISIRDKPKKWDVLNFFLGR